MCVPESYLPGSIGTAINSNGKKEKGRIKKLSALPINYNYFISTIFLVSITLPFIYNE